MTNDVIKLKKYPLAFPLLTSIVWNVARDNSLLLAFLLFMFICPGAILRRNNDIAIILEALALTDSSIQAFNE